MNKITKCQEHCKETCAKKKCTLEVCQETCHVDLNEKECEQVCGDICEGKQCKKVCKTVCNKADKDLD